MLAAAVSFSVITGTEERVIERLSPEAIERLAIAISAFTDINNRLVKGDININLLKIILERRDAYLALLKIGNKSEMCPILKYVLTPERASVV